MAPRQQPAAPAAAAAAAPTPTKLPDGKLVLCVLGLPLAIAVTLVSGAGMIVMMGAISLFGAFALASAARSAAAAVAAPPRPTTAPSPNTTNTQRRRRRAGAVADRVWRVLALAGPQKPLCAGVHAQLWSEFAAVAVCLLLSRPPFSASTCSSPPSPLTHATQQRR